MRRSFHPRPLSYLMRFQNMRFQVLRCLLLLALFVDSHKVSATLSRPLDVPYQFTRADVVVKGRVVSVEKQNDGKMVARVTVDCAYKGEWAGKTVPVVLPPPQPMAFIDTLVEGELAIFFLLKQAAATIPVNTQHIKIPILESGLVCPKDTDGLESIRAELLYSASGPTTLSKEDSLILQKMQGEKRPILASNGRIVKSENPETLNLLAVKQLGLLPPEERTVKLLESLLSATDRQLRGAAIEALLKLNRPEVLGAAVEYVNSSNWDTHIEMSVDGVFHLKPNSDEQAFTIARAVANISNVKAMETLGKLLQHHNVVLRRSAILALGQISEQFVNYKGSIKTLTDATTIPYFIMALNDTDAQVRFAGAAQLSTLALKHEWFPTYRPYNNDKTYQEIERRNIERWKQWWETEGKQVAAGTKVLTRDMDPGHTPVPPQPTPPANTDLGEHQ